MHINLTSKKKLRVLMEQRVIKPFTPHIIYRVKWLLKLSKWKLLLNWNLPEKSQEQWKGKSHQRVQDLLSLGDHSWKLSTADTKNMQTLRSTEHAGLPKPYFHSHNWTVHFHVSLPLFYPIKQQQSTWPQIFWILSDSTIP